MTDANEWMGRTGETWAAQWRRTDRGFAPLTERLLRRSGEFAFRSVLDIGCGAGELSLALARANPHHRVAGVDISPQLVGVARERGTNLANATFAVADAACWRPGEHFAPDLLVSRHGVMFFRDPPAAFAHLARIAAPDASLLFSCFRPWRDNPAFAEPARLLPQPPPPPDESPAAPGPFAFADQRKVGAILERAGWRDVDFEAFDFAMVVGAGEDPVEDTVSYFSVIGPAARAARELDGPERDRFLERVRDLARRNRHGDIVALRAGVWIVTARKAG